MYKVEREEVFLPRALFIELGGFTHPDMTTFCTRNEIKADEKGFYPVFKIVECLNQERKKRQHGKKAEGIDELELQKKHEEVMKLRIANQEKMATLIPRERARERVKTTFFAVANKIRYMIKNVTPRLLHLDNARTVEQILISAYNGAIKDLESEAENVTWESDGLDNQLGRTQLASGAGADISSECGEEVEITSEG